MTSRQRLSRCDTSTPGVRIGGTGEYRVSELDQKKMAPTTFSKSRGRAEGLCGRSPTACRAPVQSESQVIDMHQGTRTLPQSHSTPPWCQQRVSVSWPFGGEFVLRTAVCPSVEGSGMS